MTTTPELQAILQLRVPVIVRLGHRRMSLSEVLNLGPGAIVELPQQADRPLELMVNNKEIGRGEAVKVGENFGLRVTDIGDPHARIAALRGNPAEAAEEHESMPTADDTDS